MEPIGVDQKVLHTQHHAGSAQKTSCGIRVDTISALARHRRAQVPRRIARALSRHRIARAATIQVLGIAQQNQARGSHRSLFDSSRNYLRPHPVADQDGFARKARECRPGGVDVDVVSCERQPCADDFPRVPPELHCALEL
eukprot:2008380-Rhodomonas_salina.3